MITLGIESTAHTFGIGIVRDREVLANVRSAFTTEEGGMRPFDVAEHHADVCGDVLKEALAKASVTVKDIDLIAFSQGPGIGQMLRVGSMFARSLSLQYDKPLVGVNHCIAHLAIGELRTGATDPVLLYVSGANTQVIAYKSGKYRIFGETLDQGVGNTLDTLARVMELGFPGGPKIEKLALQGKKLIDLPYSVKGMDIAMGGVFSNVKKKIKSGEYKKEDLAFSLQETVFAMLVEVAERALAFTGKHELLLGGGVACNKRLQEMCKIMCEERGATFFVPENEFLIDNAAMIAWLGSQQGKWLPSSIKPYWRTDEVDVTWKEFP